MIERLRHRRTQLVDRRAALESALDLGARDGERRAQVVGDVVADVAQLIEQAPDLVEHEVDAARDAVEVVDFAHHRQALLEVAFHDLGDCGVNVSRADVGRGARRMRR